MLSVSWVPLDNIRVTHNVSHFPNLTLTRGGFICFHKGWLTTSIWVCSQQLLKIKIVVSNCLNGMDHPPSWNAHSIDLYENYFTHCIPLRSGIFNFSFHVISHLCFKYMSTMYLLLTVNCTKHNMSTGNYVVRVGNAFL